MPGATHFVAAQTLGARQSASPLQLVRHASLVPQTYGSQDVGSAMRHVPAPLQVRAGAAVDPVQVAGAQVEAPEYERHAPAPSHIPS